MKEKFTNQDVIDMAVELFDNHKFTRENIHILLTTLKNNGKWDVSTENLERIYDLIVG